MVFSNSNFDTGEHILMIKVLLVNKQKNSLTITVLFFDGTEQNSF